ncbi:MAG: cytochrome c-type biogenesis protein CcmH [Gammaproteobacteria bacterium]|jgi:cytochrome c-type biogenesis protein CcmH|nr:cytochrome c-type biogenesis protein CcmH [Gammaproteobacteria bacterium]MBT6044386.1 cytochrome c-type biogenesis protein CcmH [Gammaproteobacteria bacterium]
MILRKFICAFLLLLFVAPVFSAIQEYAFESEQEEDRFKKLTYEMRCPKCLNSNLAGSDAPIAADLRQEIYKQITEGRSNDEIIDFMSSRYGDFILYRPRLTLATFFLWFGPAILLVAGLFIVRRMLLASALVQQNETALSTDEQETLRKLLETKSD